MDAVPGRRAVRDRRVRLREAARDPGRPGRHRRAREPRRRGDRHPVRVGVPLPERRRRSRPDARAAGPNRRAPRHRTRLGRDPLVVDPGARREDRRDPGHGERDVVRGEAHRRLRGSVRRALRPLPRKDDRGRRGDAGRGVRRLARGAGRAAGGRHLPARRGDVGRDVREVPRRRGRRRLRAADRGHGPRRRTRRRS